MRPIRALIALGAALTAMAPVRAPAQPVASPGPDTVSVTIYRSSGMPGEFNMDWLQGYALITERRTVTIPAGRAVIRFEGVAGGILPESAIVTGLPEGVREKNLDADLLSPRSLYARSLGRPVTIRRKIGERIVAERAIIRSGPEGAAVLETAEGVIVADCDGGEGQIVYDSVPDGLTPRPTLSVETESPAERRVTLTLSYLAWGFDWNANYVATMRPDGRTADLFAWVTLANMDVTSFENAETMVVAGRLQREDHPYAYLTARSGSAGGDGFRFRCLTRYVAQFRDRSVVEALQRVPGVMVSPVAAEDISALPEGAIMVTGSRVSREELGDLKLYRVPHPTTVASRSQKQVAMIDQKAVQVDLIHRAAVDGGQADEVMLLLRAQNREEKGLGVPLPAGPVAVFEPHGGAPMLVGEGRIDDKAVNEEVEIEFAAATQVAAEVKELKRGADWEEHELTVTNANPWPIRFEADMFIDADRYRLTRTSARLGRKNGRDLWSVEVPANGTARLRYRLKEVD